MTTRPHSHETRVVLSVLYPRTSGGRFDLDYYLTRHIPLVWQRWGPIGLLDLRVSQGVATPEGSAPAFDITAHLTFASAEALQAALSTHSTEVFAHIARYTDIRPVMQVSTVLLDEARA